MERSPPAEQSIPLFAVVLMVVAVLLAGLGWGSGYWVVAKKRADVRRGWLLKPVIAAARDLKAGETLQRADLQSRDVPEQFVTSAIFTDTRPLEGQVLAAPISKGTPLHPVFLTRSCP